MPVNLFRRAVPTYDDTIQRDVHDGVFRGFDDGRQAIHLLLEPLSRGNFLSSGEDEEAAIRLDPHGLGVITNPFKAPVGCDDSIFAYIGKTRFECRRPACYERLVFWINQVGPTALL